MRTHISGLIECLVCGFNRDQLSHFEDLSRQKMAKNFYLLMTFYSVWDVKICKQKFVYLFFTEIHAVCLHFGKIEKSINNGQKMSKNNFWA